MLRARRGHTGTTRAELSWGNLFVRPSVKEKRKKNVLDISKKVSDSEIYWLLLLCLWGEVKGLLLELFKSRLTKYKTVYYKE